MTLGSLKLSGNEFQTDGPATEKASRPQGTSTGGSAMLGAKQTGHSGWSDGCRGCCAGGTSDFFSLKIGTLDMAVIPESAEL